MPILLGTGNVKDIYLGASKVDRVYLGTQLVYTAFSVEYIFNQGYTGAIRWAVNNLPRPQYTAYGNGSLDYVTSDGYMLLYISDNSSEHTHNAHVVTNQSITIPSQANYLNVSAYAPGSFDLYLCFGMLPSNASNSYSTENGGFLSSNINMKNKSGYNTYSIVIPNGYKGTALRAIVNIRGNADARKNCRINKVWLSR